MREANTAMAGEYEDWPREQLHSWPTDELKPHHMCSSGCIQSVLALWISSFYLHYWHKQWTQSFLSFKNISCMSSGLSSGCLVDDKVISLSHCGEMSNIKMKGPAGRRCIKDCFSKPATDYCRQVPVCFPFPLIFLLLFSLVTPALSIHMESIESHSEFSCEPIRLRMCQDLPYNTTFMPNLLNHYDQQTAALAMEVGCLCVSFRWCVLCLCLYLRWDGGEITYCL